MTTTPQWYIKGSIIGACNCDWGCPCSFNSPPTYGACQGEYTWQIDQGRYGDVSLDGLHMSWGWQSPGPFHEGHVTAQFVVEDKADSHQREAILAIMKGDIGGPWAIFSRVTETQLEPIFAPYQVTMNGLDSEIKIDGVLELSITSIKNPVTGNPEQLQLVKPTGFSAKMVHLGMSIVNRYTGGFKHDHSGKYAEYGPVDYAGP